jgi:hypothetical protein
MSKPKYKKWSQADDAELTLMREARTSTKEIAKALKRTPTSVTNRIATLGIPKGRVVYDDISAPALGIPKGRARKLGNFPKIETVQGSQPKPSWWTRMMWWRK